MVAVRDDLRGGGAGNRLSCVSVDGFRLVGVDGFMLLIIVVDGLD